MNTLDLDVTLDVRSGNLHALLRLGIDFRNSVEELDDIRAGALGSGNIGDESEGVTGLDSTEGRRLEATT